MKSVGPPQPGFTTISRGSESHVRGFLRVSDAGRTLFGHKLPHKHVGLVRARAAT